MSSVAEEFNERLEAFVEKYGLSHASELLKKLTAAELFKTIESLIRSPNKLKKYRQEECATFRFF